MFKFIFDRTMAIIGLLVAWPVMGAIAILVKIESSGPAIFSQERIGRNGVRFMMHKFRKFPDKMSGGSSVTVRGDVRMTRVGFLLERTKLDELPQLFNILKGDMSFVGPRPESIVYEHLYVGDLAELKVYTPGIFGPNQVAYRNEADMYDPCQDPEKFYSEHLFPAKAKNDIEYARKANIVTDIFWIIKGVVVSIFGSIRWKLFWQERGPLMLLDGTLCTIAWLLAHLLRYGQITEKSRDSFVEGLYIFPLIVVGALLLSGAYRKLIRHFSFMDTVHIAKVVGSAWVLGIVIHIGLFERSSSIFVEITSGMLALYFIAIPRLWKRYQRGRRRAQVANKKIINVAIYGASSCGLSIAQWVLHENNEYIVVGILSDSIEDRNRQINGFTVLGGGGDLKNICAAKKLDEVWIVDKLNENSLLVFEDLCEELDVEHINISKIYPFAGNRRAQARAQQACKLDDSRYQNMRSVSHDLESYGLNRINNRDYGFK